LKVDTRHDTPRRESKASRRYVAIENKHVNGTTIVATLYADTAAAASNNYNKAPPVVAFIKKMSSGVTTLVQRKQTASFVNNSDSSGSVYFELPETD
jgi:hypothetical protein